MKKCLILFGLVTLSYIINIVVLERAHTKIIGNNQTIIDSLNGEILTLQIDNGRYEIIMNRLWEEDSNFVMEHTKYIE
jgi:hypothetical protein